MEQSRGEVRWRTRTDNPLAEHERNMGERLARIRRELGLSQRRVAELSGLPPAPPPAAW